LHLRIIEASGQELRKQPAEAGEALSDDFDGTVLNPNGIEIDFPFWAFKGVAKTAKDLTLR
jgi:hypothetical protein